ncbi:MAG: hypothetical protein M3Y80_09140 [Verrucomicrobiota bacterium]|nr:hypothetical protein [Verrucomicrobiota bacterium]
MKMRRRLLPTLLLLTAAFHSGCESTNAPSGGRSGAPEVTAAMTSAGGQQADRAALETGRSLFLARCGHCHTLPAVASHTAQQWPGIVAQMSKRSGLKPEQREAVLAYILAARNAQ